MIGTLQFLQQKRKRFLFSSFILTHSAVVKKALNGVENKKLLKGGDNSL